MSYYILKRISFFCLLLIVFCHQTSLLANNNDSIKKEFYIPPVEYKTSIKDFILPTSLLTIGTIATLTDHKDIISWDRSGRKYDNFSWDYLLLGGVAGSMFVFDQFIEAEHKPFDQAMLLVASAGLSMIPAYIIKESYESFRPDGTEHSFPSGHTTTGFMIAHVLNKEFRNSNIWVAYGGYVIASAVSFSRIAMNKHWVCDILAGAGLGILGTELAYLVYFPIRNKIAENLNRKLNKDISFNPAISTEAIGLSLNVKF
ncbi:phosphatase PAP2 family protein [Bacteroidales bacterium OttesenSCG-928-M06]|nr:phosphatase PAP2 family protein [Bacteroidales bacterium OttesenSCG-928-M06]